MDPYVVCEFVDDVLVIRHADDDPVALAAVAAVLRPSPETVHVVLGDMLGRLPDLADLLPAVLAEWLGGAAGNVLLHHAPDFGGPVGLAETARSLAAQLGNRVRLEPLPNDGSARPPRAAPPSPPERCSREVPSAAPTPVTHFAELGDLHGRPAVVPSVAAPVANGGGPHPDRLVSARFPIVWRSRSDTSPDRRENPPGAGTSGVPGQRSPAGWSFCPSRTPCRAPIWGAFVVELELGSTGPLVEGRPATVRAVAAAIDAARHGQPGVLILLLHGGVARSAEIFLSSLARNLGTPVLSCTGPVFVTASGVLVAPMGFRRWAPSSPDMPGVATTSRAELIDRYFPPRPLPRRATPNPMTDHASGDMSTGMAVGAAAVPERAEPETPDAATQLPPAQDPAPVDAGVKALVLAERSPLSGIVSRRPSSGIGPLAGGGGDATPGAPHRRLEIRPAADGPEPPAADELAVIAAGLLMEQPHSSLSADDQTELRRMLNGRYDAHGRVVTRLLAEQPGLRSGGTSHVGTVAGLVAVQAYVQDLRGPVNEYLRGAPDGSTSPSATVARCAAAGLRRLPAAHGPVFTSGTGAAGATAASRYRPGDELVEPGFIDVGLDPGTAAGEVQYVIWSASARRLGPLGRATERRALFPPGSRFTVLAVEPPVTSGQPARVLLRDRVSTVGQAGRYGGPTTDNEQVVARLQAASDGTASAAANACVEFALGLDTSGRPFRQRSGDTVTPAAQRDRPQRRDRGEAGAR
ncbi:hypothetical protein ABZ807_19525 [Micromonospora sp. NPDC047548]|uniref:hypothetical protein n=1 Tax=Micromonospora sp. NPDC047548 TaxID=3155624 RepID=UPI0033FF0751